MKHILLIMVFITNFIFSQEIISFDDFEIGDFENGIMYFEQKIYKNNTNLTNEYKDLLNEIPIIKKYSNADNMIYSFTGYVIDNSNNVCIITVKLKLSDMNISLIENELLNEFAIDEKEIKILIENMNEAGEYIFEGKDTNGSFSVEKRLYFDDSYEFEDYFGMIYAYIIFSNLNRIKQENISRRLMYYILEYTY